MNINELRELLKEVFFEDEYKISETDYITDYIKYDEKSILEQEVAKRFCSDIESLIKELGPGREQSIAITKLEEVYMWVGKAIRNRQIERLGLPQIHLPERG